MAAPPNIQQTVDWATMTVAEGLYNEIKIARNFNTMYQKDYKQPFAVGATIRPRLPWRFKAANQIGLVTQGMVDRTTTITMDNFLQYSVEWDSVEMALTLPRENLKKQFLDPIMRQAGQDIDSLAAQFAFQHTNMVVGNLGSALADLSVLRAANRTLTQKGGQVGKIAAILTPGQADQVVGLSQAIFNPQGQIGEQQYKKGEVGPYASQNWLQSVTPYTVTAGTAVTAISVTGAGQDGNTLNVTGTSTQVFEVGDKFGIGSGATAVNYVNPATRRTQNALQCFTVTERLVLSGSVDVLKFSPAIIGPGSQYQNVDTLPADAAAIVLWPGTSAPSGKTGPCGLLFSDEAFAIVGSELEQINSAEFCSVRDVPGTPIKVRISKTWDVFESRMITRCDILVGFGELQPDNCAVLLASNI